jgi:heptaprenylglyceryl phosphate synthase
MQMQCILSLLSGGNLIYLNNNRQIRFPLLQNPQLEIIPTSYLLINGGHGSQKKVN